MAEMFSPNGLELPAPETVVGAIDVDGAKVIRVLNTDTVNRLITIVGIGTFTLVPNESVIVHKHPSTTVHAFIAVPNSLVLVTSVNYPRG